MTLRSRLVLYLLPPLVAMVLVACFFIHYTSRDAMSKQVRFAAQQESAVIAAYSPHIPEEEHLTALIASASRGLSIEEMGHAMTNAIGAAAVILILGITALVLFIAYKVCEPIHRLKKAALDMAAGNYSETIHLHGAQDLVEIANGLNTLSDCLEHTATTSSERRLRQEPLCGEYECALLAQQYCLQAVVDSHSFTDTVDVRLLSHPSYVELSGTLFDLAVGSTAASIALSFAEARKPGLPGLHALLRNVAAHSHVSLSLDSQEQEIRLQELQGVPEPLLWRHEEGALFPCSPSHTLPWKKGDLLFLANSNLVSLFPEIEHFHHWLAKPLQQFAGEGLETCISMLSKELAFITRKRHVVEDLHLIGIENVSAHPLT